MTVEAEIYALLQGLVEGRVFPDGAPFDTPRPYITYQQIGGEVINYGSADLPDKENGMFQINVWDDSRAGAKALIKQVDDAFRLAAAFQARPVSAPISQHEPELARYGAMQDFSVWSER